ncbi:Cohesin subunit SA-2 [Blomia tropicalis]|nr:Cohesin subunit SA-2 [Blomia tropicalis]
MPRGRPRTRGIYSEQESRSHDVESMDTSTYSNEDMSYGDQSTDYVPNANDDSNDDEDFTRRPRGRGRGRGRRGRPPGRSANRTNDYESLNTIKPVLDEVDSLFETVRQGRCVLQSVVDEWIELYRQDRENCIIHLMQFFIRSSGCKGRITAQMRQAYDNAQIIRALVDEFDENSGDYPLILTGPVWKKFRQNFCEFIHTLIRQCQYSIIYDQFLMENMISLLISLSDSQVRAFRHTATLAAMKLITALVDVALTLSINLDNTQRQYESERQKTIGMNKRPSERLELLTNKRHELEENNEDIKTMLGYLFKSIFVHRYRDIFPEIRSICMTEIGIWMKRLPGIFLDDSYLKYVGWTLHDKIGDVRLNCLKALLPLYESEEITRKMELFTNKFKDRIVSMTLDKEPDVAVMAIKLVINIHKHHRDVLLDKDCEHVYELVFATNRSVAQTAGEFLNERLFQIDEQATENLRSRRGKKRSVHTPLIRDLIQFFIECELHEHGAYLVDSLIESHPMMKDWECMSDLLLEEPGLDEEPLEDKQETSLIEIMVCCIRQASTCEPPVGRGSAKKQLTSKEQKSLQEDKARISEHFINSLPIILNKYKSDKEKVANLLSIPQYLDLNFYSNHTDKLESLLRLVNEIVDIHSDREVLEVAAKTFEYLYDENFSFSKNVSINKSTLIDNIFAKYREAVEAYSLNPNGDEEKLMVNLQLKKISVFYACHDLTSWNLWNDIFDRWVRTSNQEGESVPILAVKYAIISCHMGLIWELHQLSQQRSASEKVKTVKNMLFSFMTELRSIMNYNGVELEEEAYISICDLLIIFSHHNETESPAAGHLVYKPDTVLIKQLENFIQRQVFVGNDDPEASNSANKSNIEVLHKRRHFLAAFCKLIVYTIIPIKHAACVIKHYVKFYNDYGDIIKTTLGKTREINKVMCAKTMATALISVFLELRNENPMNPNAFTKQDESFQSLKELAKRFALSFGLDNMKNRDAVAALHREGIHFTFNTLENPENPLGPPPNLPFLEIIIEFSNKLIKIDKKTVLSYLDRYVKKAMPGVHNDEWQPLISYRASLQQSEFDVPFSRAPGRQYRMRKKPDEDGEEVDGESDQEGSEMAE